jgi:Ca2+-binding EF-hand superfamily protein
MFVKADANKDGKLDKSEWMTLLPEQVKARADLIWGRADQDGDGFLTREQFMAPRMGPRQS